MWFTCLTYFTLHDVSEIQPYSSMKSESVNRSVVLNSLWPHGLYGLSTEFSRQEYWNGLLFPTLGDLPNPEIEPGSPTLQVDALASEPSGKSI